MLLRAIGLLGVLAVASCAASHQTATPARSTPESVSRSTRPGVRYVHSLPEQTFWVSHESSLDRVVAGGARLELRPTGEVLAAAWEADPLRQTIAGSLAVPERLGGGFVHWSASHVFRSR